MIEYSTGFQLPQRRRRLPGPLKQSFAAVSWAVASLVLLVGLGAAVGYGLAPIPGWLSPVATLLLMIVVSVLVSGVRRTWDLSLLSYLEQAVRLNLPLPAILRAAEESEGGRLRVRLARLRRRLSHGESIEDALTHAGTGLPRRVLARVGAAERSGQLAPGLCRLVAEERRQAWPTASRGILTQWYPLIMLIGLAASTSIVTFFVLPKYQAILHDFHVPMPRLTQWVFGQWSHAVPWLDGVTMRSEGSILCLVVVLIYCGQAFSRIFSPHWTGAGLLRLVADPVVWRLPIIGRCVQGRAMADVCYIVADALEAGGTLEHALVEVRAVPGNLVLNGRLSRWNDGLLNGVPIAEAARRAHLPNLLAGMLATAQGEGDVVRVLRFLAAYYEGAYRRASEFLQAALLPAMALFFGTLVATIVLALFLPMVELIDRIASLKAGM